MKENVLICGGSKGIGAACVRQLSKNYNVHVASRTAGSTKGVTYHKVDLSSRESVAGFTSELTSNTKISILINNSGGPATGGWAGESTEDLYLALNAHLMASHEISKAVVPHMKSDGNGRIINIVSVTAKIPLPNMCVSNTVRGAMINWSKTLSKELGSFGITVNNILTGYTETERLIQVLEENAKKLGVSPEEYRQKVLDQIPAGRFARPEEVSSLICFLASKDAAYINGASIPIDGGWLPCI